MIKPGRLSTLLQIVSFAGLAACAPLLAPSPPVEPAAPRLTPVQFSALAGWAGDDHAAALDAFKRSCGRLSKLSPNGPIGLSGIGGRAGDWQAACRAAHSTSQARVFFETWFSAYRVGGEGLFTGYFEAELKGARRPGGRYRVPIYRRPPELATAGRRPYATRAQIEAGALAGRGLELLWVDDPVDAFFLHIQGSGRVVLADGAVVRLGFAGRNGRAYTAIGRELVARGEIAQEKISMQAIRAWLTANPGSAQALMNRNASYIFFRVVDGAGPIGAQGVALTPGRSLAVDKSFVPLGAPLWLDTVDPLDAGRPLRRLVVAQDTGSAITGPVRGDLFWGFGAAAAERAGRMQSPGRYYVLLPRSLRLGPRS